MAIFLNEQQVADLLDMPTTIVAVERAMRDHATGAAVDVPRQRTRIPGAVLHMLQGACPANGVIGFKAYTTTRSGARFWLHLFDAASGAALAVVEADHLGMMRTGATGGIAAKLLARPDARVAAVIGAGWQARGQIEGLCSTCKLDAVRVYSRRTERLAEFCRDMGSRVSCPVVPAISAADAVEGADIVVTVTNASDPVLQGAWLAPGAHVNAAGSNAFTRRELDAEVFARAGLVCVDSREVALRESGDLLPVLERGRISERRLVEIGELIAGLRPGRSSASQITVFESQGMAIQDLSVGAAVLQLATQRGVGTELPF